MSKSGSQAVERALRLLKLFSDKTPQLSVAEAVAASGLNRTTVFRLLTALQNEGFLTRLADGSYGLGSELVAVGSYAQRGNHLWQAAHPVLVALGAEIDERVTLEALSTDPQGIPAMLVVDEISAEHVLGIREFVGNHLPIHATSTGKVILAFVSAEERNKLLAHKLEKLTPNTLDASTIAVSASKIRQQGYAEANEELAQGLIAAAVPIFDTHSQPCAAISVVVPAVRIDPPRKQAILQKLIQAGRTISQKMGYR